jgi:hypothetical protein
MGDYQRDLDKFKKDTGDDGPAVPKGKRIITEYLIKGSPEFYAKVHALIKMNKKPLEELIVLIVEDYESIRNCIAWQLEILGLSKTNIIKTKNPVDAIEKLRKPTKQPNIVFIDHDMRSHIIGSEFAREIRTGIPK